MASEALALKPTSGSSHLAEDLVAQLPSDLRHALPDSETDSVAAVADFTWSFADSMEGQPETQLGAGEVESPTIPISQRQNSDELWKTSRPTTPEPVKRAKVVPKYVPGKRASGVVRSVPYTAARDWKQSLDIYLPEKIEGAPVILHVHGGGWSRGDRTRQFYGAPGLCDAYAGMGFVAIAISYRLGNYPQFVHDAAAAVAFALRDLRAEPALASCDWETFLLSGHSAGAHIVALLLSDPLYFKAAGVESGSIKAAVLLSGLYTLRNPFGAEVCTWKNWAFQQVYLKPAFPEADINAASPCWRLAQAYLPPDAFSRFLQQILAKPKKNDPPLDLAAHRTTVSPKLRLLEIPVSILSAESDLGLEFDSDRLFEMLRACNALCVRRLTIPKTSHPSICTSNGAYPVIAEAIFDIFQHID